MSKTLLGYWDIRGLGEPIRLMLEQAGAEYEDKRYTFAGASEWAEKDKQGLGLAFPNLPYLFDGDVQITESWAIMRHLGRKHDLNPAKGQEYLADVAEGVVQDFRKSFADLCYKDYDTRSDSYFAEIGAKLDRFEAYLAKHVWMGGDKLTYVDFALCEILNQMSMAHPKLLSSHPKMEAYLGKFEKQENICAYRASSRFKRFPCNGPMAKWGGKSE